MAERDEPAGYDAFISYRHADPDRRWARWLHTALETYRTPARLVREQRVAARIGRVFRDEDEVPASADLGGEIDRALEASRFLIVVCSPRTPASAWINREIERFRELGRSDQILALLIEGDPASAFPRALRDIRRRVASHDVGRHERIEEVEPLAADVRPHRGESPRQRRRMARLRLLACLLGCRFDDLRRREEERRRRRWTLAASAALLVAAVMTGLALVAFEQKGRADLQRMLAEASAAEARRSTYRAHVNLAQALIEGQDYQRARAVLDEAAGAYRGFEHAHLKAQIDPCVAHWQVSGPVLDVLDRDDDGVPDRVLTPDSLWDGPERRALPGPRLAEHLPVAGGFLERGLAHWRLFAAPRGGGELLWSRGSSLDARRHAFGADVRLGPWAGCQEGMRIAIARSGQGGTEIDLFDAGQLGAQSLSTDLFDSSLLDLHVDARGGVTIVPAPQGTARVESNPRGWTWAAPDAPPHTWDLSADDGPGGVTRAALFQGLGLVFYASEASLGLHPIAASAPGASSAGSIPDRLHTRTSSLHTAPKESWCAAVTDDHTVVWWSLSGVASDSTPSFERACVFAAPVPVTCLAASASDTWAYVGTEDGQIRSVQIAGRHGAQGPCPSFPRAAVGAAADLFWTGQIQPACDGYIAVRECFSPFDGSGYRSTQRWLALASDRPDYRSGEVAVATEGVSYDATHALLDSFRMSAWDRGNGPGPWDSGVDPGPTRRSVPTLSVYRVAEDEVVQVVPMEAAAGFAVAADGLHVAFQQERRVWVQGTRAGPAGREFRLEPGEHLAGLGGRGAVIATWDPAKSTLNVLRADGAPARWAVRLPLGALGNRGRSVAIDVSGERVFSWLDESTIGVLDGRSGGLLLALRDPAPRYPGGDVRISADGSIVWTTRSIQMSSLRRDTEARLWLAWTPAQYGWWRPPATSAAGELPLARRAGTGDDAPGSVVGIFVDPTGDWLFTRDLRLQPSAVAPGSRTHRTALGDSVPLPRVHGLALQPASAGASPSRPEARLLRLAATACDLAYELHVHTSLEQRVGASSSPPTAAAAGHGLVVQEIHVAGHTPAARLGAMSGVRLVCTLDMGAAAALRVEVLWGNLDDEDPDAVLISEDRKSVKLERLMHALAELRTHPAGPRRIDVRMPRVR